MEIILLEKITNLGGLGDRVKVKPGYARNFLIPKGKATEATPANLARFEARRAELERIAAELLAKAKARAEQLAELIVTLSVKTGSEGRLVRLGRCRRYRQRGVGRRDRIAEARDPAVDRFDSPDRRVRCGFAVAPRSEDPDPGQHHRRSLSRN
jgi:hypothetical protein